MKILGFNKLTLLDYPGKTACTVFLGYCNFRCPFCQNAALVLAPEQQTVIDEEEVLAVLKKRQGILEGVCISGGEPTLSEELEEFIKKVKALGYAVKLDTNGYRPDVLASYMNAGLLDYVAMDIKSSLTNYAQAAGIKDLDTGRITASVELLMESSRDYEFRTTVVRELHQEQDLREIGDWIQGCKQYFLQSYRESPGVIKPVYSAYPPEQMAKFKAMLQEQIAVVELRGI